MKQALTAIRDALANNPNQPVNITGYSRGAEAANSLATALNKLGIAVTQLTLIDPVQLPGVPQHLAVPPNVASADDYYQSSGGPFHGGAATNPSKKCRNHDVSGPDINHNTVVSYVLGLMEQASQ
jgi:hypothetical protein